MGGIIVSYIMLEVFKYCHNIFPSKNPSFKGTL